MRRTKSFLNRSLPKQQKGYTLIVVLVMMLAIAALVVGAVQSYSTEMRISSNDADRKATLYVAETALRAGEQAIADAGLSSTNPGSSFTENCTNGFCSVSGDQAAWLRSCGTETCLDSVGVEVTADNNVSKKPRYIVEYLYTDSTTDESFFRVTARAWGENANTVVTLQSYAKMIIE